MPTRSAPLYVCIPQRLLLYPVIAPRRGGDETCLTPFEFAVLTGVLAAARAETSDQHFQQGRAQGGADMKQQRQFCAKHSEDRKQAKKARRRGEEVPAPKLQTTFDAGPLYEGINARRELDGLRANYGPHRPPKRGPIIKRAGREGFRRGHAQARLQPAPPLLSLSLSAYQLLRLSALSNGVQRQRLAAALDRLCQPVGGAGEPSMPPLDAWQDDGPRLLLQVAGAWLDPPYGRVPMPLPLQSAGGLALYLFLHAIKNVGVHRDDIGFRHLCERLRLPMTCEAAGWRALIAAMDAVNKQLWALTLEQRRELLLQHIEPPELYRIEARRGTVHFEAVPCNLPDEDAVDSGADDEAEAASDSGEGELSFRAGAEADEAVEEEVIEDEVIEDDEAVWEDIVPGGQERRPIGLRWREPTAAEFDFADEQNED
jgi:hypothetical protein